MEKIIFGFDVGTGSLGEAIRVGNDIIHTDSLLIDPDYASTRAAADKRRMIGTRVSHKAREFWLNNICRSADIPILKEIDENPRTGRFIVQSIDPKLLREFPKKGDNTVFTSCLLRIKLLENPESLEPWQIYKALHSAVQKRGYGPVVWRSRAKPVAEESDQAAEEIEDKDFKETKKRLDEFEAALKAMSPHSQHHFCCYFDAWKMGLWSPEKGVKDLRQTHLAEPASISFVRENSVEELGGYTPPRKIVEDELRALLLSAKKIFPKLDADFAIFGPAKKEGASFYKEERDKHRLKRGHRTDWNGLLNQKIPRFDNRIIAKCALMTSRNTCKASAKEYKTFHFLQKLHLLRFADKNGEIRQFSPTELSQIWTEVSEDEKFSYKLTKAQLKKILKKNLNASPLASQPEIPKPKESGRSRFCRSALRHLKDFYLSGKTPRDFYNDLKKKDSGNKNKTIEQNEDPTRGLTLQDIDWLTHLLDRSWRNFSIPDYRYESLAKAADSKTAINSLIGEINNPIVRHRLSFLVSRVEHLTKLIKQKYGREEPDQVNIEFVREDFMGERARKDYIKWINQRQKENEEAKEQVAHLDGKSNRLKYQLAKEQGWLDIFSDQQDKKFGMADLAQMEIEHIVPRALGGPDGTYNKVLTARRFNSAKGDRTPYDWLASDKARWTQYLDLLKSPEIKISNKKYNLLISPDAVDLVNKYTTLAETAWIAKLSQTIIHLFYEWHRGGKDTEKKIRVLSGGLTAKIRRKYRLNELLGEQDSPLEKNRKDKRHHALDAMVITFLAEWARDPKKENFLRLPNEVDQKLFQEKLNHVLARTVCQAKPKLQENFYGLRGKDAIKRFKVRELAYEQLQNKTVFSLKKLKKKINDIYPSDNVLIAKLTHYISNKNNAPTEESWQTFVKDLRGPNGAKIKYVSLIDNKGPILLNNPEYDGEYKVLESKSKHHGIQVLKPKGRHKGQIIYRRTKTGKFKVRPIYVHEPKHPTLKDFSKRIIENGGEIWGFVKSGDLVEVTNDCGKIKAGKYTLATLRASGDAEWKAQNGEKIKKTIDLLIKAGLRVIKK